VSKLAFFVFFCAMAAVGGEDAPTAVHALADVDWDKMTKEQIEEFVALLKKRNDDATAQMRRYRDIEARETHKDDAATSRR
jgi:hypothetical protein